MSHSILAFRSSRSGSNRIVKSMLPCNNHHRSMITALSCQQQRVVRPTVSRYIQQQKQQSRPVSIFRSTVSIGPSTIRIDDNQNRNSNVVNGNWTRRCFATLPPHEIVGLPSLSPVCIYIPVSCLVQENELYLLTVSILSYY